MAPRYCAERPKMPFNDDPIANPSAADARRHIAQIMLTVEHQQSALNWLLMAQIATTITVAALLIVVIIR
jgi:hypothetical protein